MRHEPRISGDLGEHVDKLPAQHRDLFAVDAGAIFDFGAIDDDDAEIAEPDHIIAGQIAAGRRHRRRIEKAEPAFAGAAAILVIAARHDPGRGGKQRRRRLEEIGIPGVPAVTGRAAGAAGIAGRAGIFAVFVIADMDHQIGAGCGRHGGDFRERPGIGVVAGLRRIAGLKPAAGVAEHHDALRIGPRQRQRLAVEQARDRSGGTATSQPRTGNEAGFTLPKFLPGLRSASPSAPPRRRRSPRDRRHRR